ncbi:MAG: ROK family protein [Magnetococcales bacterium]|nr:ROK family protein [Magnetococcales bacterium]MBF0152105.1 ROK family protein [Magnetococcales bacterium]MBF0174218.1 ROK family protein [Magnetococcales bacterium]MBF0347249.1 ROK family protein [Magnetococcales bacterium]MBF0632215.1 ROK family protein [Magnetococcales bacterium]
MAKPILGLDLGGTKIASGLVDLASGNLLGEGVRIRKTFESEKNQDVFDSIVAAIGETLSANGMDISSIGGVGMCVPSPVDPKTGFLYNPPNLRGWGNIPLRDRLREIYDIEVAVDNDANAAAMAESRWGAARGLSRSVFYATVSTGIGTGIIINGAILHGKNGLAGEGGHVPLDGFGHERCGCGNIGCIEALASGTAMVKLAREMLRKNGTHSLLVEMAQGRLEDIDMVMIGEAARRRDAFAQEIVVTQGMRLGLWLGGMVALFDPEMVVIGGGCANLGEPLFQAMRQTMIARTIHPKAQEIPVVPAQLGTASGVMGAASLL